MRLIFLERKKKEKNAAAFFFLWIFFFQVFLDEKKFIVFIFIFIFFVFGDAFFFQMRKSRSKFFCRKFCLPIESCCCSFVFKKFFFFLNCYCSFYSCCFRNRIFCLKRKIFLFDFYGIAALSFWWDDREWVRRRARTRIRSRKKKNIKGF